MYVLVFVIVCYFIKFFNIEGVEIFVNFMVDIVVYVVNYYLDVWFDYNVCILLFIFI